MFTKGGLPQKLDHISTICGVSYREGRVDAGTFVLKLQMAAGARQSQTLDSDGGEWAFPVQCWLLTPELQ